MDKHETEENIAYRRDFMQQYFNQEIRTHRWFQITFDEYEERKKLRLKLNAHHLLVLVVH